LLNSCKNRCKKKLSCKCYMDGQRMNMYNLTIYIIHGAFGDIMLSHYLWLGVGCDFIYATKTILVVNVGCICFIITIWHLSSSGCGMVYELNPTFLNFIDDFLHYVTHPIKHFFHGDEWTWKLVVIIFFFDIGGGIILVS
jgi:hypothetical protein